MALCLNCGKEIKVIARQCPYCKASITTNSVTSKEAVKKQKIDYDSRNNSLLLLGVVLPIIGIIYWFKLKEESPLKASSLFGGCLIGFIIRLVFITFLLIGKVL